MNTLTLAIFFIFFYLCSGSIHYSTNVQIMLLFPAPRWHVFHYRFALSRRYWGLINLCRSGNFGQK